MRKYRHGDMAHPVEQRTIREQLGDLVRDPDVWVDLFLLGVILWIMLMLMNR